MVDVFIVGAGPAGAAAGRLLASWGWSVVIAHRVPGRPSLAESLPPSTRKLLAVLGQLDAIEAAAFHPNHGNLARWAGETRATETDVAGYHVSRAGFDEVLRFGARDAGARLVDAVVRRVEIGDPFHLEYGTSDERAASCDARYVLDCSGRAGVVARRGWRPPERRYRTLAITAEWESDRWPANEQTRTIVESYRDGWAWSVPLSPTRRQFTVMVDPPHDQHKDHRERNIKNKNQKEVLNVVYARELAKARELHARLAGARQTSKPWACDASLYHAPQAADGGVLLVGDAASFIEPLSSAGVKKALASAWRAAVVVNTALARPSMASAAADLFTRRERDVYVDCCRLSARFFRQAAAAHDHPFWSTRAEASAGAPTDPTPHVSIDAQLVGHPNVRAAFDALRQAPSVRLRPAPALRIEPAATIEGREVVLREALVLPGIDTPVRFAAGVNLPALVGLTRECGEMSSLISAYHAQVGPVGVDGLLTGLSVLVAHHALINEGSPS